MATHEPLPSINLIFGKSQNQIAHRLWIYIISDPVNVSASTPGDFQLNITWDRPSELHSFINFTTNTTLISTWNAVKVNKSVLASNSSSNNVGALLRKWQKLHDSGAPCVREALASWAPYLRKFGNLSIRRLRVVPHFSSGIVERAKRERAWKSPHARKGDTRRRERKMRDYRQSPSFWTTYAHFSLSPPRVAFSRVGWFSRALAFRSLYYTWGKMGDYSGSLVLPSNFGNYVTVRPPVRPHHRETNIKWQTF